MILYWPRKGTIFYSFKEHQIQVSAEKAMAKKQENNKQEEQTLTLNTEQTNIHKNNEPEQERKIQSS